MKKTYLLIIGIFLIFTFFAVVACKKEKKEIVASLPMNNPPDTLITGDTTTAIPATGLKFLALGDSYTIGQSVEESARFPAQTVELLKMQKIEVTKLKYIATTGWTTGNLLAAIDKQKPARDFDIVTLLIGVNDQYHYRDTSGYRNKFSQLLIKAIDFARGNKHHVFVLSIPDYSVTPFVDEADKASVSVQIDEFNVINKDVALQNGVAYVDITASTRRAATDPSLIANDRLHPSAKEYAHWTELLVPVIKEGLQ